MKCIFCGSTESKVIDSRSTEDGARIRRRRECVSCGKRFTTYEYIEATPLLVVKSGGNRESFDPAKIKKGIIKACEKRPVPMYKIDELVEDIQKQVFNTLEQEITSKRIGELVMTGLKKIDDVAYIRFASVYRQFKDTETFIKELEKIISENNKHQEK
ncbi:MAG: transcriptional regulator NrdR [Clostridia bacterium]|nr:transcriptional regulator NrdR [Clostridia bacterium]